MTPAYEDGSATVYLGDVREVLAQLPAESVQCVVTSPPYWGLRDYGTATWDGGDAECDHVQSRALKRDTNGGMLPAGQGTRGTQSSTASSVLLYRESCGKCGARRIDSQLGLEPTPQEYVASMVAVFREVRRVLRDDGTLWLNLGDSYSSGGRDTQAAPTIRAKGHDDASGKQAYLRSDIIWSKPNPMPESVTDRPTKAHEYVFLLTKSEHYHYDADAIREPHSRDWAGETVGPGYMTAAQGRNDGGKRQGSTMDEAGRNKRSVWTIATQPYPEAHFATYPERLVEPCILAGCPPDGTVLDPFSGSGTTLSVAKRLGRRSVGVELNPAYVKLIAKRVGRTTHQPSLLESL